MVPEFRVESRNMEHHLRIANDIHELRRMSAWLREIMEGARLTAQHAYSFEQCANEAVANIMQHASGAPSFEPIQLTFRVTGEWISLRVADKSSRFDPIAAPLPAAAASLDDAVPGGKGLVLIRRLLPESTDERTVDSNVLVLRSAL
jgi:anti-sigma regulatory factor (Ser/Thr protein kinase)